VDDDIGADAEAAAAYRDGDEVTEGAAGEAPGGAAGGEAGGAAGGEAGGAAGGEAGGAAPPAPAPAALTASEAAVVAAALAAARASRVPALAWLSFTAGAWVAPSGPTNAAAGTPTEWTREASAGVAVLATAAGDVLAFREGVLLAPLPTAPRDGAAVLSLAPYSRGFLAGSAGGGLRVFELCDPEIHAAEMEDELFAAAEAAAAAKAADAGRGRGATPGGGGGSAHSGRPARAARRLSARSRVMKSRTNSASSARSTLSTASLGEAADAEAAALGVVDDTSRAAPGPLGLGAYFVATRTMSVEAVLGAASPEPSVTFLAVRPAEAGALVLVAGTQCLLLDLARLGVTEGNGALAELACLSAHTAAPGGWCGAGAALDAAAPKTTIQVKLADGKRLVVELNLTHTVGDLVVRVAAANATGGKPFTCVRATAVRGARARARARVAVLTPPLPDSPSPPTARLKAGFPPKALDSAMLTIEAAGLKNASVQQQALA